MNQMKIKWMASILTVLLFSLSGFTYAAGPTPEENNSSSTNQALKHINKLRQEMNLPEVVWNPALAKAADNHARYYEAHKEEMTLEDPTLEQSGLAGFTGKAPLDRVQYAGFTVSPDIHIAETLNVNVSNRSLADYIGDLMYNGKRREIITDPDTVAVGFAEYNGITVLTGAIQNTPLDSDSIINVYPHANRQVPSLITWDDISQKPRGIELTVHTNRTDLTDIRATLEREVNGRKIEIDLIATKMDNGKGYHLLTEHPLREGATYTASVTIDTSGEPLSKTWEFQTDNRFNNDRFFIDDIPITTPIYFQYQNNRVLIPMRIIFEELGATVNWDKATQTITAKKDNIIIRMTVGESIAYVNNKPVQLDSPPRLDVYTTYVPLRFVSEALGYEVNYIHELQIVEAWSPLK